MTVLTNKRRLYAGGTLAKKTVKILTNYDINKDYTLHVQAGGKTGSKDRATTVYWEWS